MTGSPMFALRPRVEAMLERIGAEGEPLLVIDDVLEEPGSLVSYAAEQVRFEPVWGPSGGYPGVRAPAPLNYVERLVRGLKPMMERAFDLEGAKLANAQCSFSMVTLPPDRLAPAQQVPHIDTTDPLQFAVLHYLCSSEHGGTAFYRHRATGFETLTDERMPTYERTRLAERTEGEATGGGYITGDTAHFQQIGQVPARFNRVAIYRSRLLHSGQIPPHRELLDDPRRGRLSANIFVTYRQR